MPRPEAGASRPGPEAIRQNHWSRIPPSNASNVTRQRRTRITCIQRTSRERSMELKMNRPPLPPFTAETAAQKARLAEDAWNTRDPAKVALAYSVDSIWRNRAEFIRGREAIEAFLRRKWIRELEYRLIKEVWAFRDNRIAVRFAYEWHDDSGNWCRSYGNENWEFDEQ